MFFQAHQLMFSHVGSEGLGGARQCAGAVGGCWSLLRPAGAPRVEARAGGHRGTADVRLSKFAPPARRGTSLLFLGSPWIHSWMHLQYILGAQARCFSTYALHFAPLRPFSFFTLAVKGMTSCIREGHAHQGAARSPKWIKHACWQC